MNEFHKPFVRSLIIIALVTVFTMVSSRYIFNYYNDLSSKTLEYSSEQSQKQVYSAGIK